MATVEQHDRTTFRVESSRVPSQVYLVDFSNPRSPQCTCDHGRHVAHDGHARCRHIRQCILFLRRQKDLK